MIWDNFAKKKNEIFLILYFQFYAKDFHPGGLETPWIST